MPIIPNFPQDLLDQHHHWHSPADHPGAGAGRVHGPLEPGGGLEFLVFHRDFMAQVLAWYNATNFAQPPFNDPAQKAALVAPWLTVPAALKTNPDWPNWAADATRLDSQTPGFASDDELGRFIETGIHNQFLHGAASTAFGDPVVRTLHSPQSTLFYGIHGLVSHWWAVWQRRAFFDPSKVAPKLGKRFAAEVFKPTPKLAVSDVNTLVKDFLDHKPSIIDVVIEPPQIPMPPGPVEDRLKRLERHVFPNAVSMSTFIHADERPHVGPPATGEKAGETS